MVRSELCPFQKTILTIAASFPNRQSLNGNPIEIWGNGNADVKPFHGDNLLELDNIGSGKLDGVYQMVKTEEGQTYELTFYVRAHGGNTDAREDDNAVVVEFNGLQPKAGGFKPTDDDWTLVTAYVTGTGGEDKLVLRESSPSDGSGPLVDYVQLIPVDQQGQVSDCGVEDNMVINCSFESNEVPDASMLRFSEELVPGWFSLRGEQLEMWSTGFESNSQGPVPASDGDIFLELDNHGDGALDGIYQYIKTEKDKYYKLQFDVRARGTDLNSDDESVVVEWRGSKPKYNGYHAVKVGEWTTVHVYVVGSGDFDKLVFRESTTTSDGTG